MDLETCENLIYGIKNRSREGPSYEAFLDLSRMKKLFSKKMTTKSISVV